MSNGIDGTVELIEELDRLSATSDVAASAPRGTSLYRYLANGLSPQSPLGIAVREEFEALAEHLLARLDIWWSESAGAWRSPRSAPPYEFDQLLATAGEIEVATLDGFTLVGSGAAVIVGVQIPGSMPTLPQEPILIFESSTAIGGGET